MAVDPLGAVDVAALRDPTATDDSIDWDIATAADHLGLTVHTLRYYERVGLLAVNRDAAGRRHHDDSAVRRLVFINRMRTSGMSIRAALQHYVELVAEGDTTMPTRLALLRDHRARLRDQIAELQLALATTEYKITSYETKDRG